MGYNWEKIFSNKTDKELYKIYSGKSHLGNEAKSFAEIELKKRKFNFKNIDRHKKKWKLEKLIQDEREENKAVGPGISKALHVLLSGILGTLFTLLMVLDIFFNFLDPTGKDINGFERFFYIAVGLGMSLIGFISYRIKKKRERIRNKEIKELLNQL